MLVMPIGAYPNLRVVSVAGCDVSPTSIAERSKSLRAWYSESPVYWTWSGSRPEPPLQILVRHWSIARRIIGEPSVLTSASRAGQFSGVGANESGMTRRDAQSQPRLSCDPPGNDQNPCPFENFRSSE